MVSQQICKSEPKRAGGEKSVEFTNFIPGRNLFLCLNLWSRSYDIFCSWFTKLSDFAVKIVPAFLVISHDCFGTKWKPTTRATLR